MGLNLKQTDSGLQAGWAIETSCFRVREVRSRGCLPVHSSLGSGCVASACLRRADRGPRMNMHPYQSRSCHAQVSARCRGRGHQPALRVEVLHPIVHELPPAVEQVAPRVRLLRSGCALRARAQPRPVCLPRALGKTSLSGGAVVERRSTHRAGALADIAGSVRERGVVVGWISLDGDDTPNLFGSYLAAAFEQAGLDVALQGGGAEDRRLHAGPRRRRRGCAGD